MPHKDLVVNREYHRAYYHRNKDRITETRRLRYALYPEKYENNFQYNFMRCYSLTLTEYNTMLEEQNGVCAICKQECSSGQRLCVDHNHETGEVRALLCKICNRRVGQIEREDTQLILNYLNMYKPRSIK